MRAFAAEGAKVGFVDLDGTQGAALAAELEAAGARVSFRQVDITDTAAYQAAIRDIEAAHGATLVLVNNAANDTRHDWRDVTPEYFDSRIAVNLTPRLLRDHRRSRPA